MRGSVNVSFTYKSPGKDEENPKDAHLKKKIFLHSYKLKERRFK